MSLLSAEDIFLALAAVPDWSWRDKDIIRTYTCSTFAAAIDFVRRIAAAAEEANHHPDIDIRYRKVTLFLTTHSDGGLTEKDFALARHCDQLFAQ